MKRSVLGKGCVVEKDRFDCFECYCCYIVLKKGQLEATRASSNSSSSSGSGSGSSGSGSSGSGSSGSGKSSDARFDERTRALRLEGGHG